MSYAEDVQCIEPLFSAELIRARVTELAAKIRADVGPGPLVVIGVLKGSCLFMADLVRALHDVDIALEFLGVRSYEGTTTTGQVRITHDLRRSIEGERVLLVEDIVDTGLTLRFLVDNLMLRQPSLLKVASLLDKPERRKVAIEPDYTGFVIEDLFVVGYGLDLDQRFRNLPYVGVWRGGDTP